MLLATTTSTSPTTVAVTETTTMKMTTTTTTASTCLDKNMKTKKTKQGRQGQEQGPPQPPHVTTTATANATALSFPQKLHHMLQDATVHGFDDVCSWQVDGTAFKIHDSQRFVSTVMPSYFAQQTKYKSFQRMLNIYNFLRVPHGPHKGCYWHKSLRQDCPNLAATIHRYNHKAWKKARQQEQGAGNSNISGLSGNGSGNLVSPTTTPPTVKTTLHGEVAGQYHHQQQQQQRQMQQPRFPSLPLRDQAPPPPPPAIFDASSSLSPSAAAALLDVDDDIMDVSSFLSPPQEGKSQHFHSLSSLSLNFNDLDMESIFKDVLLPQSSNGVEPSSASPTQASPAAPVPAYVAAVAPPTPRHQYRASASWTIPPSDLGEHQERINGELHEILHLFQTQEEEKHDDDDDDDGHDDQQVQRQVVEGTSGNTTTPAATSTMMMSTGYDCDPWQQQQQQSTAPTTANAVTTTTTTTTMTAADYASSSSMDDDLREYEQQMDERFFPNKLYDMLEAAEVDPTKRPIISWVDDGRAFKVHDPKAFTKQLMPLYFDQTQYESFRRQLNMYGFVRVARGTERGTYHHADFQRGNRPRCRQVVRRSNNHNHHHHNNKQQQQQQQQR